MADLPDFQPPPTYALPILEVVNPATGQKTGTFNPVWLKWFVDLTAMITRSGGGGGVIVGLLNPEQIGFGAADRLLIGSEKLTFQEIGCIITLGSAGTPDVGIIKGGSDDSMNGAHGGYFSPVSANGTGKGGDAVMAGGQGVGGGGGVGGKARIFGGMGTDNVNGGNVEIDGGPSEFTGNGGDVIITGGSGGTGPGGDGGNVRLVRGPSPGGGVLGEIIADLPTSAPATSGALWRDAGAGNVVKCVP